MPTTVISRQQMVSVFDEKDNHTLKTRKSNTFPHRSDLQQQPTHIFDWFQSHSRLAHQTWPAASWRTFQRALRRVSRSGWNNATGLAAEERHTPILGIILHHWKQIFCLGVNDFSVFSLRLDSSRWRCGLVGPRGFDFVMFLLLDEKPGFKAVSLISYMSSCHSWLLLNVNMTNTCWCQLDLKFKVFFVYWRTF